MARSRVWCVKSLGISPGWPEEWVLEMPAHAGRSKIKWLTAEPLPPLTGGLVRAVKAYKMLTPEAAVHGDRNLAYQALLAHSLGRLADLKDGLCSMTGWPFTKLAYRSLINNRQKRQVLLTVNGRRKRMKSLPPNPLLEKLGLTNEDRVVIFHADDIGMCQATHTAYANLIAAGAISSASVMSPCPWFPATAKFCRDHHEHPNLDMGLHLTLTSEWESYRWGPVAAHSPDAGLLDEEGYFYRGYELVQERGTTSAVERELRAQFDRAIASGIQPTHVDSHMGALFHPRFLPLYLRLAQQVGVPALLLRPGAHERRLEPQLDKLDALASFQDELTELESSGYPLLDSIEIMPLDKPENRLEEARNRLERLPSGVSYFIIHPAQDTPELRAIARNWTCRVADYELFMSSAWRKAVEQSGVKVIGWKVLKELAEKPASTS